MEKIPTAKITSAVLAAPEGEKEEEMELLCALNFFGATLQTRGFTNVSIKKNARKAQRKAQRKDK
jgi:hypothetical protein